MSVSYVLISFTYQSSFYFSHFSSVIKIVLVLNVVYALD